MTQLHHMARARSTIGDLSAMRGARATALLGFVIATFVVAALVTASFLSASGTASSTISPEIGGPSLASGSIVPSSPASSSLAALAGGGIFHIQEEVFVRHGSAAGAIGALADVGTLPETYVRESWVLLDEDATILEGIGTIRSLDGSLVQRSRVQGSEVIVENLATGDTVTFERNPRQRMAVAPQSLLDTGRDQFETAASAGRMGRSEVGQSDGSVAVVFEESIPAPAGPTSGVESDGVLVSDEGAVTIPYLADLDIVQLDKLHAFSLDFSPLSQQTWAVDSGGDRVLVESTAWLAFEALDAAAWAGIVGQVFGD